MHLLQVLGDLLRPLVEVLRGPSLLALGRLERGREFLDPLHGGQDLLLDAGDSRVDLVDLAQKRRVLDVRLHVGGLAAELVALCLAVLELRLLLAEQLLGLLELLAHLHDHVAGGLGTGFEAGDPLGQLYLLTRELIQRVLAGVQDRQRLAGTGHAGEGFTRDDAGQRRGASLARSGGRGPTYTGLQPGPRSPQGGRST